MTGGRLGQLAALTLALVLALTLVPAAPADATDVSTSNRQRLLGEVTTERITARLSGGAVARGDVIRLPEDDPHADVRSRIAQGRVAGTESMLSMSRRESRRGAVAGINGGYFLPRPPWGAPNGLFVQDGQLLQGQAVNRSGNPTGRGMVGWPSDGPMVMDRIRVTHELDRPFFEGPVARIDELNRQPWPESHQVLAPASERRPDGELILYSDAFGTAVDIRGGSTIVTLDGMDLRSQGTTEGVVAHARDVTNPTTVNVPEGQHLLVGYGERAEHLAGAVVNEPFEISTTIAPEGTDPGMWDDLDSGVAGGQLLVRSGQRRPASEWTSFAAFGDSHVARQPRTAIGRTGDGEILLVTVDGRRRGWSDGMTMGELADTMIALGARDAVNLDGGGSTTMVVEGSIRNRPSETGRAVADGLWVYVPQPGEPRSLAEACTDQVMLAATTFDDVPGTTHAESITCLSGWSLTTGVTPTTYAPGDRLTRAQYASFLARWIDDLSSRGSGNELPESADLPFTDVGADGVHADAIARLSSAGVIAGRTATTFAPDETVTRGQTAALLARAIEYITGDALPRGRDTFTDDNTSTHETDIDRLATAGIVTGTGGLQYRPDAAVNRGAVASVVMRAAAMLVEDGVVALPDDEATTAEDPDADADDDADDADGIDDGEVVEGDDADDPDGSGGDADAEVDADRSNGTDDPDADGDANGSSSGSNGDGSNGDGSDGDGSDGDGSNGD